MKQLSGKLAYIFIKERKQSLSFEDLPGHRSGVLLMELMSSGHISKNSAVPGGDYQYLLNALFVFIMQPQLILWNNSTDWLCKTEAFGLDMLRHLNSHQLDMVNITSLMS